MDITMIPYVVAGLVGDVVAASDVDLDGEE